MKLLRALGDLVAPPSCHICGVPLGDPQQKLCAACAARLVRTGYHRSRMNPVESALAGLLRFEKASAVFHYSRDNVISQIIKDFKYHDYPSLALFMGRMMARELYITGFFSGIDGIVPVPVHWSRRLRRGYNQSEMLARGMSQELEIPVLKALHARRHSSQTGMTHTSRRLNVSGKFFCPDGDALGGKHLLLIDDVCTTGSTLIEAGNALLDVRPDVKLTVLTLSTVR